MRLRKLKRAEMVQTCHLVKVSNQNWTWTVERNWFTKTGEVHLGLIINSTAMLCIIRLISIFVFNIK